MRPIVSRRYPPLEGDLFLLDWFFETAALLWFRGDGFGGHRFSSLEKRGFKAILNPINFNLFTTFSSFLRTILVGFKSIAKNYI